MDTRKLCNWYFASHGCDLDYGHGGDVHQCLKEDGETGEYTGEVCFEWAVGAEYEFTGVIGVGPERQ